MMRLDEYCSLDATALAGLVQRREVTAGELTTLALRAVDAVNPELNAVIGLTPRETHAALGRLRGDEPLAGVPYLVKDLGSALAGELQEWGSRLLKGHVAAHDGELIRRFKAAGMVAVGRSNVPEFGDPPMTEPLLYGPTHNPWKLGWSAGGSSGGAAAAVAAGVVPIAHASDAGGSIRIPAGWCGLVGLKPSRGRCPMGPDESQLINFPAVEHVVARTVRDCAAALDATCGPDDTDFIALPRPERPFADECRREPGRLRVAAVASLSSGVQPAPDRLAVFSSVLRALELEGHAVEPVASPVDLDAPGIAEMLFSMYGSGGSPDDLERFARRMGRPLSLETLELGLVYGWGPTAGDPATVSVQERLAPDTRAFAEYQRLRAAYVAWLTTVNAFFRRYDVLVTLTNAADPPRLGQWRYNGSVEERAALFDAFKAASPGVFQWNLSGHPAMTLPLGTSDHGFPVGIQIATALSGEATLYRLASQLEHVMPWHARRPPVHAALSGAGSHG
jgi:amidase